MPGRNQLVIPRNLYRLVVQHCKDEVPLEACGILVGVGEQVRAAYPMTNVKRSPVQYLIKAEEQALAFRDMDDLREELVAIYHSHPTKPAVPSGADISLAYYPEALYLIVSLAAAEPEVHAYRITLGQVTRVPVQVEEDQRGEWRDRRDWGDGNQPA